MVQEEFGFRHWVGEIPQGMTRDHIISWWETLPSVGFMFFNPNRAFPMPLIELEDVAPDDAERATWGWVDAQGKEQILDRSNVVLFAHVHMDDDSYLKIPQGDYIYHAGYTTYEDNEDQDETPPPTQEQLREWASESPVARQALQALHPEVKL